MSGNIHFIKRSHELRQQKEILGNLGHEIDKFIRLTDKYKVGGVKIEMDSQKIQETLNDLLEVEKLIDVYKNQTHRSSRVKVNHWEGNQIRGQRDEIVGIRRKIIKKLSQLETRVKLMRNNVSLFKFDNRAVMIESVGKQLDNMVDMQTGKMNSHGVGDLMVGVALLLAFMCELVRRKDDELE